MSETSSDCVLSGFLLVKSQSNFNIKQNLKKVSPEEKPIAQFPFALTHSTFPHFFYTLLEL